MKQIRRQILLRRGSAVMRRYLGLLDLFPCTKSLEEFFPYAKRLRRRGRACALLARRFA